MIWDDNHTEPPLAGTRILIIEDNPADVVLAREMLAGRSPGSRYQLIAAGTLADGLRKMDEEEFDVVLLDLSLPDSFGFRSLSTLRSHFPDIPVVVMTGFGDQSFASRAIHEGAQGFISKNAVEPKSFRRLIRQAIVRKHKQDELVIMYRFLKITNRHSHLQPMAEDVLREVQAITGCRCVRLRVITDERELPTVASVGFQKEGEACETCVATGSEVCRCLQIATGQYQPAASHFTAGGSFYVETGDVFRNTADKDRRLIDHICANEPYESVALVPIRYQGRILGVIHLADYREYMLSSDMIELLEKVAMHIGAAIQRIHAEEALNAAEVWGEILRSITNDIPLAIMILDEDNRSMIHVNTKAAELLQRTASEIQDCEVNALFDIDWEEMSQDLALGQTYSALIENAGREMAFLRHNIAGRKYIMAIENHPNS